MSVESVFVPQAPATKPRWIESYCENGDCQVRYFRFLVKTYDGPEKIVAKKLWCPLCGKQRSYWVRDGGVDK